MRWKSEDSQTDTELEALYQVHTAAMRWKSEDSQTEDEWSWRTVHLCASMRWKSEDSQTRSQYLLPLTWCFALACERHVMRLS